MPPIKNEQERREIIRRLEQRYQQAQAKRLQAETESVHAAQEEAALLDAQRRAQLPFPPGDICPECWLMHGRESVLYPVPADDPAHYDRMKCGICEHTEDRRSGLR